jgi:urea transport system substrate-binding protein
MSDPSRPSTPDTPGIPAGGPAPAGEGTQPADAPAQETLGAPPTAPPAHFPYLDPPQTAGDLGTLGGYRVLRVLGQGGMGVVFEAEDPLLGRRVALKVPLGAVSDETSRQRFLREARLSATLPHEHIAAVFQAGHHNGVPFLALELLRGESLEDRLERDKALPVAEALRIAREIAEGLQAAHVRGLVHRDIKPANIWLEGRSPSPPTPLPPSGGEGGNPLSPLSPLGRGVGGEGSRAKILDFGVAREFRAAQSLTRSGTIVGSVGYMAPEQVLGNPPEPRTDLFALGCVLHQMLLGRLPFSGPNTFASLHAVVHEEPDSGGALAQLPPAVIALLAELLQKDLERRPASAAVVVERLQQIERELARPATATGRKDPLLPAPGTNKRLPWGVPFGAVVLLAAAAVGVLALARKLNPPEVGGQRPEIGGQRAEGGPKEGTPSPAPDPRPREPIKVGVLHSLTGPLASNETPVVDATLLAIDEINQSGGVLGRKIKPILVDGLSTEEGFGAGAMKLLDEDVVTIFGCWTASARRHVGGLCALRDNLLVYPINSEGLEESPYVFYIGGAPNQLLTPTAGWAVGILKKRRFFLVGSDYVYSHACNAILRDEIKELRAECVGEEYVPLLKVGPARCAEVVRKIRDSGADAILNTIDGNQVNIAFFQALAEAGIRGKDVPCISFSFYEVGLQNLDDRTAADHYYAASYFQSLPNQPNRDFLQRLQAKYPTRSAANDPMATAYTGVHLWAKAVAEAGSDRPDAVRKALAHQQYDGPEGLIRIDPATNYAVRRTMIGRAVNNREIKVVFWSPEPVMAEPFAPTRTRAQWEDFLHRLYLKWGHSWEAPAEKASR